MRIVSSSTLNALLVNFLAQLKALEQDGSR